MTARLAGPLVVLARQPPKPKAPARSKPPVSKEPPLWSFSFQSLRDPVLFIAGLVGVAHEALIAAEPRWSLLLIFGAMMGLPPVLRADEARRNGGDT